MQIRGGRGKKIVHRWKIDPNFFFREEIHGSIEQEAGGWADPFWNRNKRGSMEKKKKRRASRDRAEPSFSRNGHIHWNERSSRAVKSHEISFRALFIENSLVRRWRSSVARQLARASCSALALSFPPSSPFSLCSFRARRASPFEWSECKTLLSGRTHNYQS